MSEGFITLASFLRPLRPEPVSAALVERYFPESPPVQAPEGEESLTEYVQTFGAIRRFRAAVADALDVCVQRLLEEIAQNVLARELARAGADVAAIVAKTRERFSDDRLLTVRVHPQDRAALRELAIETVCDESLTPGDIVAELRSGTIDLRLSARLENALACCVQ
jgi:flagellar biosynthesis/type III secretory pathway protein FliH